MSYEFKRLGEVEALNEVPENANVLVEVGGAIKRVPGSSLGGGSSEVVILPETEMTGGDEGMFGSAEPLSAMPTDGATATVTYNGVEYTSPIMRVDDEGVVLYVMGNTDEMGIPGGNTNAPFVVILMPDAPEGLYCKVLTMDSLASVTLSIVQTEGGACGGGTSGDFILIVDADLATTQRWSELSAAVRAGRGVRMEQRVVSGDVTGCIVSWLLTYSVQNNAVIHVLFYNPGVMFNSSERYAVAPGENDSIIISKQSSN